MASGEERKRRQSGNTWRSLWRLPRSALLLATKEAERVREASGTPPLSFAGLVPARADLMSGVPPADRGRTATPFVIRVRHNRRLSNL